MANACTALNTVTRKPGLSGFFSSSERTSWHISAGVAVFENCDVEEEEEDEEEEVLLLDVVRLPGAALLRSSSFPPSLWSFEDLETLPLLRRLSPPLVFSSDDGEKEEEEEEEEALLRPLLPLSQRRAPPLVSLLLLLDDDDVVTLRGEGAPERRSARIFFFLCVYLCALYFHRGRRGKKRRKKHSRGSLFFPCRCSSSAPSFFPRFVALLDCECVYNIHF